MPEATHEERMKVRRDECRVRGHSWDAITPFGDEDPRMFVCSNCGRSVLVKPASGIQPSADTDETERG